MVEDLHETVYGELQYAAWDLDGHHWLFSRHARDLSPDQWGLRYHTRQSRQLRYHRTSQPASRRCFPFETESSRSSSTWPLSELAYCFVWNDERGEVVAEMAVGGSRFWLADESPVNLNFSPESLGGGSVRMIMIVDDPDAAFERAIKAGATVVWPVENQEYGWSVGRIADPFGHR